MSHDKTMHLVQAYLAQPHVKKVLLKKPSEEGFSLIELVVVVAVLAILAAIAIPAFTSINDEARVSGAKTTLANLTKECAVKLVGTGSKTYQLPTLNSYTISASVGSAGTCGNTDRYQATPTAGVNLPTFILDAPTGGKSCINAGAGSNYNLGCTNGSW